MKNYDDIINLPHHKSSRHQPMSMENRAAQFAPFAALTGHDEVIAEAARITEQNNEMSEYEKDLLSLKLKNAMERGYSVSITCFQPDKKKKGGRYHQVKGKISCVDTHEGILRLNHGEVVRLSDIREIGSTDLENIGL